MSIDASSLTAATSSSSTDTSTLNFRPFANLDLTEEQRSQIRSIFKNAKSQGLSQSQVQSQIDAVLTTSQLATLKSEQSAQSSTSSQGSGNGSPASGNPFSDPNGPFANLDLTSTQSSQIQKILSSAQQSGQSISETNAQISAVLTTSQQATFASDLASLPQPPGSQTSSSASSSNASTSNASTSNSGIDLTKTQQEQIEELLQNADESGTSVSDTISQVFSLLTSSQKSALTKNS